MTLLKKHCARYGIPRMIVSDGGPQFTSQEFNLFMEDWGINHVTSTPMHKRANGKVESAVKIMKSLLVKTHKEGGDPYEAMLEQRNTPRQDTGLSPAEMMFNRRTRSFLPSMSNSSMDPLVKESVRHVSTVLRKLMTGSPEGSQRLMWDSRCSSNTLKDKTGS